MPNRSRSIRVFLSSTFIDMQAERDYLVKYTFPAITKIAKQRHVDFSVVDLRWGVTEEEAITGKIIEVCLDEIKNTHPFFIGLLGDRYGWCPEEKDVKLSERVLEKYPWLIENLKKRMSITEIEMRYGILDNADPVCANFYIRDSNREVDNPRLTQLRRDIESEAGERYNVWHFSTPKQLGGSVYRSLLAMLDKLYPVKEATPEQITLDKQNWLIHTMQGVFLNQKSLQLLDEAVTPYIDRDICVILKSNHGEGKTALISNWRKDDPCVIRTILNHELNKPEEAYSHLISEYKQRKDIPGKITWVIDGLEYLQSDKDRTLEWLADDRTAGINLVLTTSDEVLARSANVALQHINRECTTVQLVPPSEQEREQIIALYLLHYAKQLLPGQVTEIARCPLFSNMLFLRIFLQELVQFGSHEKLDAFIHSHIVVKTPKRLLLMIFNHLENNTELNLKAIRTYFGMLATSRIGISEQKLQQATGLNSIDWAAFNELVSLMIVKTDGLIALHPQIIETAEERYMGDPEEVNKWRREIIAIREQESKELLREAYHRIRIHIFRGVSRFFYWLIATPPYTANNRLLQRYDADLIWQYMQLGEYYELARRRTFLHLSAIMYDPVVGKELQLLCTQRPQILVRFLHPRTLFCMAYFNWPDTFQMICTNIMKGGTDNLVILRDHIRRCWMPVIAKIRLTRFIDRLISPNPNLRYANIEDTWEATPLDRIKLDDLISLLTVMPYISGDRREHIEQETDKIIARCEQRGHIDNETLAVLYAIRSYCFCARRNYLEADEILSKAVSLMPIMYTSLALLRYMISLGLEDEKGCREVIETVEKAEQTPEMRGTRLTMQALEYYFQGKYQEVQELGEQMAQLFPNDPVAAHAAVRNLALLFGNINKIASAYIHLTAVDSSPDNDTARIDILEAANDFVEAKDYEQARNVLTNAEKAFLEAQDTINASLCRYQLAYSYIQEAQRQLLRKHIQQCYRQYESHYQQARKLDPYTIDDPDCATRVMNHSIAVCEGALYHHVWDRTDPAVKSAVTTTQYIFNRYPVQQWAHFYALCFLTGRQFAKMHDVIGFANYTVGQIYKLEKNDNPQRQAEIRRQMMQEIFDHWTQMKPVEESSYEVYMAGSEIMYMYRQVWNGAYEPYILPLMQDIAENEAHEQRPLALASLLLYAFIAEDKTLMNRYLPIAEQMINTDPQNILFAPLIALVNAIEKGECA